MVKALLPQAFWFRLAAACPRIDGIPGVGPGRITRPARVVPLTDLSSLEGRGSWASVRVGWNPGGLGIAVLAGWRPASPPADRPEGFADVNLWIDTRDTRNVSRATRFCHRFAARLTLSRDRKGLSVQVNQRPIARAVADAPIVRPFPDLIPDRADPLGLDPRDLPPRRHLNGFDPETNRRLGFAYQVSDHIREDQFLGVGRDFPLGENPSLWATLELKP